MSSSCLVEMALPSLMTPFMYSKCSGGNWSFMMRSSSLASSFGTRDFGLLADPFGRPGPRCPRRPARAAFSVDFVPSVCRTATSFRGAFSTTSLRSSPTFAPELNPGSLAAEATHHETATLGALGTRGAVVNTASDLTNLAALLALEVVRRHHGTCLARPEGLEPSTSSFAGMCSSTELQANTKRGPRPPL